MKKYLYLVVEQKNRELDAKLLLAMRAAQNGYTVILGTKRLMNKMNLFPFPRGIFFYKDAMASMEACFRSLKSQGYKVVVHDEEGFVQFDWDNYVAGTYISEASLKYIDAFLCWGNQQEKVVKKLRESLSLKFDITSTGHPRLDLLKENIKDYNNDSNHSLRPIILINTKFGVGNYKDGVQNYLNKQRQDYPQMSMTNWKHFQRMADYDIRLLNEYTPLISKIVDSFPEAQVVIRPHPVENIQYWENLFGKKSNVTVTMEHPVGFWLQKASVMLHTGCTTAIEGFLVGTPVIAYTPIYEPEFEIELPNKVSFSVSTLESCLEKIKSILGNNYDHAEYEQRGYSVLSDHLCNINCKLAADEIILYLSNIFQNLKDCSLLEKFRILLGFKFLDKALKLKLILKGMRIPTQNIVKRTEISDTISRLANSVGETNNYKVKSIVDDIIFISK